MPYVEVWVDEPECDGKCSYGKELLQLEAKVQEAERLLRAGYPDAALHALTNDAECGCKAPEKIREAYERWKAGKLDGFVAPGAAH